MENSLQETAREQLTRHIRDGIHFQCRLVQENPCTEHFTTPHGWILYYPYTDAAVIVVDSIGEWDTFTVWHGTGTKLKKVYSQSYPHSLGLWYPAMTQRVGLKPNEEEYILMGWAALGDPKRLHKEIYDDHLLDH